MLEFIDIAEAYSVDIFKYSSSTISVSREHVVFSNIEPVVLSDTDVTIESAGSENILNIMRMSEIGQVFSSYFWRFGELVDIRNNLYSLSALSANTDLVMTKNASDYYFLQREPGQKLVKCSTSRLSNVGLTLDSARDTFVLSLHDINQYYIKIGDTINISGKKATNNLKIVVSEDEIHSESATFVDGSFFSKIKSKTGTIVFGDVFSMFIEIENSYLSNNAELNSDINTNTKSIIDTKILLSSSRAPYRDWNPEALRKTSFKSEEFIDTFTDILLSGDSIPEEDRENHYSVVSRIELSSVLESLKNKIIDLEVCDDN